LILDKYPVSEGMMWCYSCVSMNPSM